MRAARAARAAAFAAVTLAGAAGAETRQGAPITYANHAGGAAYASLAGGGEGSYGYGRGAAQTPAVIDLRRAGAQSRAASDDFPPGEDEGAPGASPGQGAPDWLERERVGPPYEAGGRWYAPTPEPGYAETGEASWYGPDFHGRDTASGEPFDQSALTAAHPTLPLLSLVQVTNLENGREAILRVNDRGPFVGGRLIDVSRAAASVLGFEAAGRARVHVRYLGPAPRRVAASGPTPVGSDAGPAPAARAEGPLSLLPPHTAPPEPAASYGPAASASYAAPVHGGFVVQVGAFADAANAERVRADIAGAGPVIVEPRVTARGTLYRVRMGPWTSRGEAETAQDRLVALGYADAAVATP